MSRGARIILGGFLVVCALGFLGMVPLLGGVMFPFALFCGVGAVACFSTGSHPITVRILGGTVFAVCLAYLVSTARDPMRPPPQAHRRPVPAIVYGLCCFALIGLPAGYAAVTGRYPLWGRGAEGFHGPRKRKRKRKKGTDTSLPPDGSFPPRYPPRI